MSNKIMTNKEWADLIAALPPLPNFHETYRKYREFIERNPISPDDGFDWAPPIQNDGRIRHLPTKD